MSILSSFAGTHWVVIYMTTQYEFLASALGALMVVATEGMLKVGLWKFFLDVQK